VSLFIEASLRALGFVATERWVSCLAARLPHRHFVALDYSLEQTALLQEQRASCLLFWKPTCLPRALARLWALRRCGARSAMKVAIGARASTNGKPEFHAWLEQAGETLGDSQTLTQAYVRLGINSENALESDGIDRASFS